jgi:hypothetical protein
VKIPPALMRNVAAIADGFGRARPPGARVLVSVMNLAGEAIIKNSLVPGASLRIYDWVTGWPDFSNTSTESESTKS